MVPTVMLVFTEMEQALLWISIMSEFRTWTEKQMGMLCVNEFRTCTYFESCVVISK